jgi:hypothetical protein
MVDLLIIDSLMESSTNFILLSGVMYNVETRSSISGPNGSLYVGKADRLRHLFPVLQPSGPVHFIGCGRGLVPAFRSPQ